MGRGDGLVLPDQGATWTGVGVLALSTLLLALGNVRVSTWRRAADGEEAHNREASERS
jgi:hypothetical protein